MTESTLAQAIETTFYSLLEGMHTCMPGLIDTINGSKATVIPLIKKIYIDGDSIELAPITNVPVVFPVGKAKGLTFELERGDGVLLLFSERALERWKGSGNVSEPGDNRKFDLSDGIAIPGLFSFNAGNIKPTKGATQLHNDGQTITIKSNGDIELGSGSLRKLVTEAIVNTFNTHVHTATAFASPTTPPQNPLTYPDPLLITPADLTQKVEAQ